MTQLVMVLYPTTFYMFTLAILESQTLQRSQKGKKEKKKKEEK